MSRLRVTEIFHSLQGEGRTQGFRTVFVRLTGCPLRCRYCDTEYAFKGGEWMTLTDILSEINRYSPRYVTVTGGEPLAQAVCLELLEKLCNEGYDVSLETSGALDLAGVDHRVTRVMDLKTPGSGEMHQNRLENLHSLLPTDQIKFVICDKGDYQWAVEQLTELDLASRCEILFSPCYGSQDVTELADWILRDRLPVRLQIQLHKYLWGDVKGK